MRKLRIAAAIATTITLQDVIISNAEAALAENQILILYNSQDAESQAIKNAYVLQHPGVHEFDLNLTYNTPSDLNNPASTDVNNRYIHEDAFEDITDSASGLSIFLAARPQILAIATTRGLPSVVTNDFSPPVFTQSDDIISSFETALAAMPEDIGAPVTNDYFGMPIPFETFRAQNPAASPRYLVTRLDSGNLECEEASLSNCTDTDHTDDVIDLITRSANLSVNQFAVSVLTDQCNSPDGLGSADFRPSAQTMFDEGWCSLLDTTGLFMHGPADTGFDPATDGPFTADYPTIALLSLGLNYGHSNCNLDPSELDTPPEALRYVRRFDQHPASFFYSLESFNAVEVHYRDLDDVSFTMVQGQILDWIATGGSFTYGHIVEPRRAGSFLNTAPVLRGLYVEGLSFAEAVYAGQSKLVHYGIPIGDPLASVTVYDPDLNDDHAIDQNDLDIISDAIKAGNADGDVDGDGDTDGTDAQLVMNVLGRTCPTLPDPDICAQSRCGDFDRDGLVGSFDLATLLANWGMVNALGDVDCDGIVGSADLAALLGLWGPAPGPDINQDGCVNAIDLANLLASWGAIGVDPNYSAIADFNCDGNVGSFELAVLLGAWGLNCP